MTTTTDYFSKDSWHDGFYTNAARSFTRPSLIPDLSPYLDTGLTMSVTRISATNGGVSSSSASSPQNSLSILTETSKSTPERTVDRSNSWQTVPPPPISLPQPALTDMSSSPVTSYSSMSEAFSMSKGTGLIRRLSRGAHNRLRRRPSTTQTNRIRDQSAGPVLVRRRSDSTGPSDLAGDMSDLDLERASEDGGDDTLSTLSTIDSANALGISAGRRSTTSTLEGGIAPTISPVLERGTWLIKVTKKKRKWLKFRLDPLAAKVCWNVSNPTKQFYIDDVRDIRVGAEAKSSRQDIQVPADQEGCWMTIVYDAQERSKGRSIKTMHLIAPNDYIVKLWTDALNVVSRERIEIMNALSASPEKSERSMKIAWKQVMARKAPEAGERIDFDDAKSLCRKLEINCSVDAVRTHFNQADLDLIGTLNYSQYEHFVKLFKIRKDVQKIYHAIKPASEVELGFDTFLKFLRDVQCVDVDRDRASWENKFEFYCRTGRAPDYPSISSMNLQAFQNFLASGSNSALTTGQVDVTLDRPLNEYFISSSHNTYLLGRQVKGTSSVEGYISALVKGCRCVEIDCWDGKDGRPIVNHGHTLTTEIMFEDCISVIARYAFATSTYPLIISLEVHCSPEQQMLMVDIMKRDFGESLLVAPLLANGFTLPSPEELKNKILIKVKASKKQIDPPQLTDVTNGRRQRSLSSPFTRASPLDSSSVPASPPQDAQLSNSAFDRAHTNTWPTPLTSGAGISGSSSADDSDAAPLSIDSKKKAKKTSHIIPALGALGVYACGIKYTDFGTTEARSYNHIYSFNENVFDRLCKEVKSQLGIHNIKHLMRVYPSPLRVDSSNFNPLQSWRRGVQMAALNWQTYDVHLQMNEAMFAAGTDRTGYVLKPEELRLMKHIATTDALGTESPRIEKKQLVQFSVEIISAQRLPRPRHHNPDLGMNPYIEFEMFSAEDKARGLARGEGGTDASARDGSSGIGSPLRKRTKIVEGNGFDPVFSQPIFMKVSTKYPDLLFVRWTVWNSPDGRNLSSNSTILATFTAKLSSLQQGYRHLPLFNAFGERYRDAKLFVKIKKEAPVTINHDDVSYNFMDSISQSPRSDPVRYDSRSWPRKIFSRAPSERRRRQYEGSASRTSSMERYNE
ncbi:hypothetical protein MBLNU459_g1019t1 [Dothideomycetes sp. NU459]